MTFHHLRPMLWTADLDETIAFYTSTLSFTCGDRNDDWGWAAMHRDGVEIMVARPNEHTPFTAPAFTGSLYVNVDAVDALWEDLRDKARVVYPLEEFEWGMREFAIYDNNGYMLQFGQDIAVPARNLSSTTKES